jgi:hypothetical protein
MAGKTPKPPTDPYRSLVLRALKQEVSRKAGDLIENILKPRHVKPPQTGRQWAGRRGHDDKPRQPP